MLHYFLLSHLHTPDQSQHEVGVNAKAYWAQKVTEILEHGTTQSNIEKSFDQQSFKSQQET